MRTNKILEKMRRGEKAVGIVLTFPCEDLVELMGLAVLDYVHFDAEHGPFTPETIDHLCRVADLAGLTPVARVPDIQSSTILRFLDRGIMGIMGPHINTRDEAQALGDACRFAPQGKRSWGSGRGTHYNDTETIAADTSDRATYIARANEEMLVMAQIESVEALENLPDILKVDSIDAFAYGPNDLAQSMGLPGQPNHPRVQEAMAKATAQIHAAGKKLTADFTNAIPVASLFLDAARAYVKDVSKG